MNEKIKEMALRCEFDVGQIHAEILCRIESDWNNLPQEERDYVFSLLEERQEGFAKLILKECTQCISTEIDRLTEYQNSFRDYEHSKRNDVDLCVEKCYDNIEMLKNHFGFE